MNAQLTEFENDCRQARVSLDSIERLCEIDVESTKALFERIIERSASLRIELCRYLGLTELTQFESLSSIATAVATRDQHQIQLNEWRALIDRLRSELVECEFRHPVKRMREAGSGILASGILHLSSLRDEHEVNEVINAWFRCWGITLQQLKDNSSKWTFENWPSDAEPLQEMLCCMDSIFPLTARAETVAEPDTIAAPAFETSPASVDIAVAHEVCASQSESDSQEVNEIAGDRGDEPVSTDVGTSPSEWHSPAVKEAAELGQREEVSADEGQSVQSKEMRLKGEKGNEAVLSLFDLNGSSVVHVESAESCDASECVIERKDEVNIPEHMPIAVTSLDQPVDVSLETLAADIQESLDSDWQETNESVNEVIAPERLEPVEHAFWRAISDNKFGLAYYIAKTAKRCGLLGSIPTPEFASFGCLSESVDNASEELILRLQQDIVAIQRDGKADSWELRVILAAISLQPALLAPETEAATLLASVTLPTDDLPSFSMICRAVLDFGSLRRKIDVGMLAGVCEMANWTERLAAYAAELKTWVNHERLSKVIYAPTTDVWREWLDNRGPIGSLALQIEEDGPGCAESIKEFCDNWSDKRYVETECYRVDRQLRGRDAKRRQIEARALNALHNRVKCFSEKLQGWLTLKQSRPDHLESFLTQGISACRNSVAKNLRQAIVELERARNINSSQGLAQLKRRASIEIVRHRLKAIEHLFTETGNYEFIRGPYLSVLNRDLPYIAGIDWHGDDESFADSWGQDQLEALMTGATDPLDDHAAFNAQLKAKNFQAATWLIESFEHAGRPEGQVAEMQERLREAKDRSLRTIEDQLRKLLDSVESAVCFELINENERANYTATIETTRSLASTTDNHQIHYREIGRIRQEIEQRRQRRLAQVRSRLAALTPSEDRVGDLGLIEKALEAGDFSTADEYINLVQEGQSIVSNDSAHDLCIEFRDYSSRFEAVPRAEQGLMQDWLDALEKGTSFGPALPREIIDSRLETRRDLLERWRRLRKSDRDLEKAAVHLRELLENLGFSNIRRMALKQVNASVWSGTLEADPFEDPNVCRIPQFASSAKGRYHVYGCMESPKDDGIDRLIQTLQSGKEQSSQAIVVIYLGQMTHKKRLRIRQQTFGRVPFLLLDEVLLSFLIHRAGSILRNFFACALPLSSGKPYTSTASFVASEMFFGREEEYREIFSISGTNLVFGGRQLGKSVLLREVERREHNPDEGIIVRWIDLKNEQIGTILPPADIWKVIGDCLFKAEVFSQQYSNADTICKHVREWINSGSSRRILLLLDEADGFLEQDSTTEGKGHAFTVLSKLKGLMDDTDRRFKVVFAGLHNVQRAARDYNTPIAHLGNPVNIGPLLGKGQWRKAKELVEKPLRHLGFQFSDDSLSIRILSHTNFYPSLIQIFCRHLLKRLHERRWPASELEGAPWLEIRSDDIDQVYKSEDLQQEIKSKFELTLDLDKRYRLLALLIAQLTNYAVDAGEQIEGISRVRLREEALAWWNAGFATDPSFNRFEIILDEMVGLGVLRDAGDGKYALRSANVLNLLGSRAKIEEMLLDVADSEPPPVYSAASFRRNLGKDPRKRSPFTAEDEAKIVQKSNGVMLVSGCVLSGLNDVVPAIQAMNAPDVLIQLAPPKTTRKAFQEWYNQIGAQEDGLRIGIVTPENFDPVWWRDAFDSLKRKVAAKKRFTRLVFIVDPVRLLHVLEEGDEVVGDWIRLGRWSEDFLSRWLEDISIDRSVSTIKSMMTVTGGWGELLTEFSEECKSNEHRWNEILNRLSASWPRKVTERDFFQMPSGPNRVFSNWFELGGEMVDLSTLKELSPEYDVDRFVRWAEELGFINRVDAEHWIPDVTLAQVYSQTR